MFGMMCPTCKNPFGKRTFGGFCSDSCQADGMCRKPVGVGQFCGRMPGHEVHGYECKSVQALRPPAAVVTHASMDVRQVRVLVDLAITVAEQLEAGKHRGQLDLAEVQLLDQAELVAESLKKIGA